jgi:hypothetical protein
VAFAAFLLLGFLEIGQEIENPFNYDANDLGQRLSVSTYLPSLTSPSRPRRLLPHHPARTHRDYRCKPLPSLPSRSPELTRLLLFLSTPRRTLSRSFSRPGTNPSPPRTAAPPRRCSRTPSTRTTARTRVSDRCAARCSRAGATSIARRASTTGPRRRYEVWRPRALHRAGWSLSVVYAVHNSLFLGSLEAFVAGFQNLQGLALASARPLVIFYVFMTYDRYFHHCGSARRCNAMHDAYPCEALLSCVVLQTISTLRTKNPRCTQ